MYWCYRIFAIQIRCTQTYSFGLATAPNVSNMRSESSLHGDAALVRAGIVIVRGQSSRKGLEASVSFGRARTFTFTKPFLNCQSLENLSTHCHHWVLHDLQGEWALETARYGCNRRSNLDISKQSHLIVPSSRAASQCVVWHTETKILCKALT